MRFLSKIKTITIPILIIFLLFGSFIFIDLKWWGPSEPFSLLSFIIFPIIILLFEIFAIFIIQKLIKDSIFKMKEHLVVKALNEKNFLDLLLNFPLVIVFEEILFRLYLFVFIFNIFGLVVAIILSALIFSIYHLHVWFEFKDIRITYNFMFISGLLGLILGMIIYYFGIITSIIIHWLVVLSLFYYIEKKTNDTIT